MQAFIVSRVVTVAPDAPVVGNRAFALMCLTMALVVSPPCRADEIDAHGDAGQGTPALIATPDLPELPGAAPKVAHHRHVKRLTAAQGIDDSVRRLAAGLDLDEGQQERLRQILVDQHRKILALRNTAAAAPLEVTGAAMAIYDQSKERIRTMLNEDQRKKYSADVPRADLGPAQADLKHWMDLQESKRRQDQAEDSTK